MSNGGTGTAVLPEGKSNAPEAEGVGVVVEARPQSARESRRDALLVVIEDALVAKKRAEIRGRLALFDNPSASTEALRGLADELEMSVSDRLLVLPVDHEYAVELRREYIRKGLEDLAQAGLDPEDHLTPGEIDAFAELGDAFVDPTILPEARIDTAAHLSAEVFNFILEAYGLEASDGFLLEVARRRGQKTAASGSGLTSAPVASPDAASQPADGATTAPVGVTAAPISPDDATGSTTPASPSAGASPDGGPPPVPSVPGAATAALARPDAAPVLSAAEAQAFLDQFNNDMGVVADSSKSQAEREAAAERARKSGRMILERVRRGLLITVTVVVVGAVVAQLGALAVLGSGGKGQ